MTLSELCIRRPVLAAVMSLMIVVFGLASLNTLPVRELPDVDSAIVTVSTSYTGAAPEVIDTQITTVIEGGVAGISGVRSITSSSSLGSGRTVIEFQANRNIDDAANDVRAAVARVVNQLPDDAEEPRVTKSDSDDSPVMRVTMTSERMSPSELTDYIDRFIVDRLAAVDGVADVQIYGERNYAIRVWIDRTALAARSISVPDLVAALRQNNVELPAGEIETSKRRLQVRTDTRLASAEEFANLVIRTDEGYPIRLKDVARVERGVEDDSIVVRADGKLAVVLGVLRQSQANTVAISNSVRAEIEQIRTTLPEGTDIIVGSDDAIFIRSSIAEVLKTLAIAMALVVLVIFAFLASPRATLIPAVTIPVSLIGACIGIAVFGYSINILTLFALILAIGIVVDDAIVVLENIQRRIEGGESRLVAAALGSRQVQFAVMSTTVTLIAVFVPISFLGGTIGKLFAEFGVVLSIAVAVSSVVALSLCPVLSSKILLEGRDRGRMEMAVDRALQALNRGYRAALGLALRMPVVVLGTSLIIAGSAYSFYQLLPKELTPREDRGVFFISITGPQGASIDYMDAATKDVEKVVQDLIEGGDAWTYISIVGRRNDPRRAFTVVRLADWKTRERGQNEIVRSIIPPLAQITDVRAFPISPAGLGLRGSRNPVRVVIGGPDFESVKKWSTTLRERLRSNSNLLNLETDYEENQPELRIQINRERARDLGIEVATIAQTLQALFASTEATTYVDRGREYKVIVRSRAEDRVTPDDLAGAFVPSSKTGGLLPLSGFVTVTETAASPQLSRYDRLPSITLSASLADGYDLGTALDYIVAEAEQVLPPSARISFSGQSKEFLETSSGVALTFVMAILIVYLVLAAQFESFVHPVIILLSVPLAVTGALATIWMTGSSLNVYSQVGLVLLVGLMAKNGILIVEFANQMRDEGLDVRDAVLEASVVRLRPILMTVISTVLGAVPLALAGGAGAESRISIGIVIIGGFGMASFLTLFLTPVLYDLLARFTKPRGYIEKKLAAELGDRVKVKAGTGPSYAD
jgi:multidrug efflux pump